MFLGLVAALHISTTLPPLAEKSHRAGNSLINESTVEGKVERGGLKEAKVVVLCRGNKSFLEGRERDVSRGI